MIDIHYRPNSLEDASLAFILHRDRGVDVDSLCQNIGTYVNDPDFCKYTELSRTVILLLISPNSKSF
jgi:hypothetical protein